MTTCVVTGVAGFVGSHLAERLLAMGNEVVGIDNFASGHQRNMAAFLDHPRFSFYQRSICEDGLLCDICRKHRPLEACFHLAAIVSVPYSVEHPEETMQTNTDATLALLDEARKLGFRVFVFAGSAAEYGADERLPLYEHYAGEQTHHQSPYGRAKFMASIQVGASLKPRGVALRFFNIFGPRQDPSSPYSGVISRFFAAGVKGEALHIFGDGLQTRDFVYVADVVDAYLCAAGLTGQGAYQAPPTGIYNVGGGKTITILELAKIVGDLCGNREKLVFKEQRPGDIRHSLAAIEKFCQSTGWQPRVSLQEGLRQTLNWYKETASI